MTMAKPHLNSKDWKEQLEDKFAYIKAESVSIASDMGIQPNSVASWKDLPKIIHQFSKKNNTPTAFVRNLDQATYEVREKIKWNTCMASQLALEKVKESDVLTPLKKLQKKWTR